MILVEIICLTVLMACLLAVLHFIYAASIVILTLMPLKFHLTFNKKSILVGDITVDNKTIDLETWLKSKSIIKLINIIGVFQCVIFVLFLIDIVNVIKVFAKFIINRVK